MRTFLEYIGERADWASVEMWVTRRRCFERTRTGDCSCVSKRGQYKGTNPCERADDIQEDVAAYAMHQPPPNGHTIPDIIHWIVVHCCRKYQQTGRCNDQACNEATHVINFLRAMDADRKTKEA